LAALAVVLGACGGGHESAGASEPKTFAHSESGTIAGIPWTFSTRKDGAKVCLDFVTHPSTPPSLELHGGRPCVAYDPTRTFQILGLVDMPGQYGNVFGLVSPNVQEVRASFDNGRSQSATPINRSFVMTFEGAPPSDLAFLSSGTEVARCTVDADDPAKRC
jgi:hypothetical protein